VLEANENDMLVKSVRKICRMKRGDGIDMEDTRVSQPAVYVAGVIRARQLAGAHVELVLGHSLGELTGLAVSGAMDDEEGLHVVVERGRICHEVAQRHPGGMVAVMRLTPTAVEWVRRRAVADTGGVLEAAAFNGPAQIVLSGEAESVDDAVLLATAEGGIVDRLRIGGAFHSPLMGEAIEAFETVLAATAFQPPRVPWLSSTSVATAEEPDVIRRSLARALLLPVRWTDAVLAAAEVADVVIDVGPGATLRNLGKRIHDVRFSLLEDVTDRPRDSR